MIRQTMTVPKLRKAVVEGAGDIDAILAHADEAKGADASAPPGADASSDAGKTDTGMPSDKESETAGAPQAGASKGSCTPAEKAQAESCIKKYGPPTEWSADDAVKIDPAERKLVLRYWDSLDPKAQAKLARAHEQGESADTESAEGADENPASPGPNPKPPEPGMMP